MRVTKFPMWPRLVADGDHRMSSARTVEAYRIRYLITDLATRRWWDSCSTAATIHLGLKPRFRHRTYMDGTGFGRISWRRAVTDR